MKEIFLNGIKLYGRKIIIIIMCFFITVSINVLCSAGFSKDIGYNALGYTEGSNEYKELYTYYYKDGKDTKKAEYENQGYTIKTNKISQMTKKGNTLFLCVTQVFCTLLTIVFVYSPLWDIGCKDSNLVKFKHKKEDIFKGLKIGITATIPSLIIFIAFIIGTLNSSKMPSAIYKFINCYNYSFIDIIFKNTKTIGEISALQFFLLFLLLLLIPLIAFIAYLLGYKDISLGEKFIYKKKKD